MKHRAASWRQQSYFFSVREQAWNTLQLQHSSSIKTDGDDKQFPELFVTFVALNTQWTDSSVLSRVSKDADARYWLLIIIIKNECHSNIVGEKVIF